VHSGIIEKLRSGGMHVCPAQARLTRGDPQRFLRPDSRRPAIVAEVQNPSVWSVAAQASIFRLKPPPALTRSLLYPRFVPSLTPRSSVPVDIDVSSEYHPSILAFDKLVGRI
jgi:hypothetical protein